MDVYHRSTLIMSTLQNRLVPTVNDSVNFSCDNQHTFERNAAGYVGLVVTVFFSFVFMQETKQVVEQRNDSLSKP